MTAPDRADASARRVSDHDFARITARAALDDAAGEATTMQWIALDLRDARQLAADQAARIAELEEENEQFAEQICALRGSAIVLELQRVLSEHNEAEARADRLASEAQAAREAGLREAAEIAASWQGLKGVEIAKKIRARLSTEGEKDHG